MPATPLSLVAAPFDSIATEPTEQLPAHWLSGLSRLEEACLQRAENDRLQREHAKAACHQIAHHIGKAGLHDLELPRGYEVRQIDQSYVLVKCAPLSREITFVASGEETLWTRLRLQATRLTEAQVRELVADLEGGLIQELVDWVASRCAAPAPATNEVPSVTVTIAAEPELQPADHRPLRMVDLGRPRRREARTRPARRTA